MNVEASNLVIHIKSFHEDVTRRFESSYVFHPVDLVMVLVKNRHS